MKEWFITRLAKNTVKGQNRAHLAELCSSKTRCSPNGLRIPGASHESVLLFLFFASEMGWGMKVEAIFVPESPCPTEILQLLLKPAISWEKSSQKRRRKRKKRYITRWSTKPPLETTDLLFFHVSTLRSNWVRGLIGGNLSNARSRGRKQENGDRTVHF